MQISKIICVSLCVFLVSCTTTDIQTISILNQRLSRLEDNKDNKVDIKTTRELLNVTIWITLSNGALLPVKFEKLEDGRYKGEKGEYYFKEPTKEQVEILYKF